MSIKVVKNMCLNNVDILEKFKKYLALSKKYIEVKMILKF